MVTRCETVLNATMAEMDAYHAQKVDDLKAIAVDHLDGEIAFYEQVHLTRTNNRGYYYMFHWIGTNASQEHPGSL